MRKEKNRTRYSISLSEGSIKKIDDISMSTGLKKTRIIDKALNLSFEKYKKDKVAFLLSKHNVSPGRSCFSTSLDKEDIKILDIISKETALNKSEIVEKGLVNLFDIYEDDKLHFLEL